MIDEHNHSIPVTTKIFTLLYIAALQAALWPVTAFRLGWLFDYSLIINGSYLLEKGLRPHKDFFTPVGSLTFYYTHFWEKLLGASYFSAAIGNLFLSIVTSTVIYLVLIRRIPNRLAAAIAFAFATATALQHGIIWYNTLAICLFAIGCIYALIPLSTGEFRYKHFALLTLISIAAFMTKVNFAALGVVFIALVVVLANFLSPRSDLKTTIVRSLLFVLISIVGGVAVELLITGCTFREWLLDTSVRPGGRLHYLTELFKTKPGENLGRLFFGIYQDWYQPLAASRAVLDYFVIYLLYMIWSFIDHRVKSLPIILMGLFFLGAASVLVIMNVESQLLTSSVFLIGLACMYFSAPDMKQVTRSSMQGLLWCVTLITIVVSIKGILDGSRLIWRQDDFGKPAEEVLSDPGYFEGISLNDNQATVFKYLERLSKEQNIDYSKARVLWGPCTEFAARLYNTPVSAGMPLWFHYDTTYSQSDVPALLDRISPKNYDWLIYDRSYERELPVEIFSILSPNYDYFEIEHRIMAWHIKKRADEPDVARNSVE